MAWLRIAAALAAVGAIVGSAAVYAGGGGGFESATVLGLLPVIIYVMATMSRRASRARVTALTIVLGLYAGLFALGASVADTSSTGGLVFLFVPLYGLIGLLAILVFVIGGEAVVEFWRGWRQRPS